MLHPNLLDPKHTALVVIDIQEAFRGVISDFDKIASRAATAVKGFQILQIPILVTEQYPKGLGRTAKEILDVLPDGFKVFEKTAFSSCGATGFASELEPGKTRQVVICGLETHVCVNQTAHDLLSDGYQVHLLTDVVCSRFKRNKRAGLEKMRRSGVIDSSIEMALFELMHDAKHKKFREIQALIK
jgi:nicotinamidase-related amidase